MRTPTTMISSRILGAALALTLALPLAGCGTSKPAANNTQFDFGPLGPVSAPATQAPLAAIVVMDATGSPALENERMMYRLNYADPLQARTYANSRWSANPLMLVTQRVKARLAQAGVKVLSATDTTTGVPIMRIEVDEFTHAFSSASQSEGQLVLRASVFRGHALLDQKTFSRSAPAPSADAAGGVRALAASLDGATADILAWLAGIDTRAR